MKIQRVGSTATTIGNVEFGCPFEFKNDIYIRVHNNAYTGVCLVGGRLVEFRATDEVKLVTYKTLEIIE